MPNGDDIGELQAELKTVKEELAEYQRVACLAAYNQGQIAADLKQQLEACRLGNAKLIYALDCAIIWAEALFAWLPEGTVMPEGIQAAKNSFSRALAEVRK